MIIAIMKQANIGTQTLTIPCSMFEKYIKAISQLSKDATQDNRFVCELQDVLIPTLSKLLK